MTVTLRPITNADVEECGRIIFEAFAGIGDRHNFRRDFPSVEFATQFAHAFIGNSKIYGVAAEINGKFVGSNFLTEWDPIRAVGPITVDPAVQARGIGRRLMEAVIERGRGAVGIRLLQDAFNTASLSLYASLGFDVKEPVVIMEGSVRSDLPDGYKVRPIQESDFAACRDLCIKVHGFQRINELRDTPPMFTSYVATKDGRVTAYGTALQFWALNHAVAETDEDLQALLTGASAKIEQPLSFILAHRQAPLFRWCLSKGLRVVKPMTLMTMGAYNEPRGAYLPSVGY